MNRIEQREYSRLRGMGWQASECLRAARVADAWDAREWNEWDDEPEVGTVRLRVEYDDATYDDSYIDTWRDVSAKERERARRELWDRIERDGVVGIIGEFFDGDEWQHTDSCWGFIGDDWKDSGYDVDVKRATLDAAEEFANSCLLQGAV